MSTEEKKMTPEEIELDWLKNVYQGDKPQLTLRALLMGAALGGFMSLSNLYVGLKTGWGLGVAITACILAFAIQRILGVRMTMLETNCMQLTASSAGYSTGGTMVSAIAAFLIIQGAHMPWYVLAPWTFFLAMLGVCMAIPMKRMMINVEQLKFPSGIACAETIKSLYSEGNDAVDKARALGFAGAFGALLAWIRDAGIPTMVQAASTVVSGAASGAATVATGVAEVVSTASVALGSAVSAGAATVWKWVPPFPSQIAFPGNIGGIPMGKLTMSFDMSAIMIAAGAIMGWRTAWSLLFGAIVNYALLVPYMVQLGAINAEKIGYREIVKWSTWTGSSIMVAAGLLTFLMQYKTLLRAFSGLAGVFSGKKAEAADKDPLEDIEVPSSWFLIGLVVSGIGCMFVLQHFFNTSWWMSIVAIVMTFFLALVACRATGETDTTPIGAMGKITQLMFGVLAPANKVTNLMTAGLTAGAAGASADLLTGLKCGHLLGANPRKQFLAQLAGIFAGTLIVVPAFYLLVPKADMLGTDQWPAPSAQVWAAVANLLANGLSSLHWTAQYGLACGILIGVLLTLADSYLPAKLRKFVPSSMGVGLAMVIPFFNSLSMFIGALIAMVWEKQAPQHCDKYMIPIASGIIAGESLMGIVVALLTAVGVIG